MNRRKPRAIEYKGIITDFTASCILSGPEDQYKKGFNTAMSMAITVIRTNERQFTNETPIDNNEYLDILKRLEELKFTSEKENSLRIGYNNALDKAMSFVKMYQKGGGLFQL